MLLTYNITCEKRQRRYWKKILMSELNKKVSLQEADVKEGIKQYSLTIPINMVRMLSWEKAQKLKVTLVMGSGQLIIERDDE